jgi:RNA polymerase sigma-70 factor (sigma-E family)
MRWVAPERFAEFVRSRHSELLRFAYLLSADRHLAEDLVQDALERAGLAWSRIEKQDDPEGYIRRIITNRFLNRLRTQRRERLVGEPPDRTHAEREPRDHTIFGMLADLPKQQRAVLVLRYYLDYSEAQIAETLGCSIGNVKSTASRAIAKLRAQIQPEGVSHERR